MRYFVLAAFLLGLPMLAQSPFVTVTDTALTDSSGAALANGQECLTPVLTNGYATPASYGTGTLTRQPVCRPIVNGVMVPSMQLVKSTATAPLNLCYRRTVQNLNGGAYVINGAIDGYGCIYLLQDTDLHTVPPNQPVPSGLTTTVLGGACPNGQYATAISSAGVPTCAVATAVGSYDAAGAAAAAQAAAVSAAESYSQNASHLSSGVVPIAQLPPIPYANITNTPTIPTSNSQLANGANYITSAANVATATTLAATPTLCSGTTPVAIGIAANGNAICGPAVPPDTTKDGFVALNCAAGGCAGFVRDATQAIKIGIGSDGTPVVSLAGGVPTPLSQPGATGAAGAAGASGSATSLTIIASSGSTQTLAFASSGDIAYDVTLSANCTFSITSPTANGTFRRIVLIIHPATFTATLPASSAAVVYAGGSAPVPSTSSITVITFGSTGTAPILGGM